MTACSTERNRIAAHMEHLNNIDALVIAQSPTGFRHATLDAGIGWDSNASAHSPMIRQRVWEAMLLWKPMQTTRGFAKKSVITSMATLSPSMNRLRSGRPMPCGASRMNGCPCFSLAGIPRSAFVFGMLAL